MKIRPDVFDIWMRLLTSVEGSVLWLSPKQSITRDNLRREAASRGVNPERLIFAQRVPKNEDHLARQRLADLFLDTLPYNAHSTASDALWAGLPVVTCLGKTFAGRVAGSLLHAVGLPELVTHSPQEYEGLALRLATDPAALAEIKSRLERNRMTYPLFDTDRLRQHIEAAYTTMWETWRRGEAPSSFKVAPI
jgi:predicted O-linked N-acetylglucosamine transferase (SPINDLY family)